MTSSLVGSEMCIRDSLCHVRRVPSKLPGLPSPWVALLQKADLDSYAVSYTHLTLPTICSV
eukprot:9795075-Prorocentrum_lima.AAC.1